VMKPRGRDFLSHHASSGHQMDSDIARLMFSRLKRTSQSDRSDGSSGTLTWVVQLGRLRSSAMKTTLRRKTNLRVRGSISAAVLGVVDV
jgi:hypothetical protein